MEMAINQSKIAQAWLNIKKKFIPNSSFLTPNYFAAFTLAEVLITLGVIGVVAAMTIPTLMNNINDLDTKTRLKKVYSVLSQAAMQATTDNGGTFANLWSYNYDNVALKNVMVRYLKVTKDCGGTSGSVESTNSPITNGCWVTRTAMDKTDITGFDGYAGAVLADGTMMIFRAHEPDCTVSGVADVCGWVLADINGSKSPNKQGKDTFWFYFNPDGTVGVGGDAGIGAARGGGACTGSETGYQSGWSCTYKYLYQ